MEKYLRKYFWTLNLATIAVCSFLAAKSVNTFVGAYLSADESPAAEAPAKLAPTPTELDAPMERRADTNPFTGQKLAPEAPDFEGDPSEAAMPPPENPEDFNEDTDCSQTSIPGTLVGTVASTNPTSGFALVQGGEQKIQLYEIGQELQTGASLVAVVRHKIFIKNGERIECMFHGEAPQSKAPPAAAEETGESGGEGVRKVSETEYIIDQGEVAKAMENMNLLATQARIVPSFKNGVANGFRIYSIKPGSLYQKIGIKNGDILQRINGMDIDSPDKALEVYAKLKSEKRISLDVLRRGSKTSLDYTIQ